MRDNDPMKARAALLVAILAGSPLQEALAWGTSGHSVIAEIAQRRLAPRVQEKLHDLLGGAISLASIAGWADNVVLLRPGTAGWHFVNIPYDASGYEPGRDCPQQSGCVIEAIAQFRATLAERSGPRTKRAEALMFLVHLVGDVHQPLHCIDRGDAGGNQLAVTFFDQPMSLHAVWDYGMIEKNTLDWGAYVRRLEESWLPGKDIKALARGTPAEWAWQAHMAAIDVAYVLPEDHKLGEAYYRRALPVLDQQLALAGIRLARLLNEALGNP
jgi:S1/P1 Nuclease